MNRFNLKTPVTLPWALKANLGLFIATILIILIHTYFVFHSQLDHDFVIDVSGRQRMLHQKHMTEVLLELRGNTTQLTETRNLLEESLQALLHGGPISMALVGGPKKEILPAPTPSIARSLNAQMRLLNVFTQQADTLIHLPDTDPAYHRLLHELRANNERLHLMANETVRLYRNYVKADFDRKMAYEIFIAVGVFLLWALLARQVVVIQEDKDAEVSHRQRAQEALRESDQRFSMAVAGSNDGFWDRSNLQSDKEWWSSRYFELLGYREGEIESSYSSFLKHLHPDHRTQVEQAVKRHLEERVPFDLEYRLRTKTGEYRWFRCRALGTWDDAGKPVRLSGSLMDITESKHNQDALRESEERLRTIVENSTDVIILKDFEGRYLLANQATAKVLGRSVSDILGKRDDELFDRHSADSILEVDRKVMDSGRVAACEEFVYHSRTGYLVFFHQGTLSR